MMMQYQTQQVDRLQLKSCAKQAVPATDAIHVKLPRAHSRQETLCGSQAIPAAALHE